MSKGDVLEIDTRAAPVLETDRDGLIRYHGETAAFTRMDRTYIAASAAVFRNSRDIAIIYPSPPTFVQLPVLLAIGYQCRGDGPPALFVSNRSGIRDQYFSLGIGQKFSAPGIEPEPLGEFTAPMVRTGDGKSVSYITNHKPRNWDGDPNQAAIVHTNFGKKIASGCEIPLSGLVLDFTTGLLDDRSTQEGYERLARENDVPRIMIFDSPTHDYLEVLEEENENFEDGEDETLFWGWSHNELEHASDSLLSPVADVEMVRASGGEEGEIQGMSNPFHESVGPLQNVSAGISREVIEIPHGPLEEAAKEAWELTNEAAQTVREESHVSSFAHQSVANSYFIYSYLDTLLSSVDYHDSLMRLDDTESWGSGKAIARKINSLRKRRESLDDEILGLGEQIEDCCDAFERMTDILREDNPKAEEMASQIRSAVDSGQSMTVLASTRKQESIIRSFITDRTELSGDVLLGSGVKFHNLYSPHTIPESDILLFPGVPTNSHYPALLAGAGAEHRFLMYKWNQSRFKRRLSDVLRKAEWRAGGGPQHHLAKELDLNREQLTEHTRSTEPRAPGPYQYGSAFASNTVVSDVEVLRSSARDGGGGGIGKSDSVSPDDLSIQLGDLTPSEDDFWATEQEFDQGQQQETINAGRSGADAMANDRGEVEALQIEFSDGTSLYEQPRGLLWKLDHSGSSLSRVRIAAQALDPGDEVIVIKDDSRRDIFEHVVEKIHSECRGPFQDYLSMLDLWVTGLDQIMEQLSPNEAQREALNLSDGEDPSKGTMAGWIKDDLKEWKAANDPDHDPTRTSNQIANWLKKETIGPSNPVVIEVLGDIYDIESLRSHSKQIFRGLEEIRTLHQRVGMNLSKILIGARESDADDWLLEEVGLRIGDVQSATTVKTVSSVSDDLVEVNTIRLGRLMST
ncbi:hypothetical protein [Natrialba sp. PRR66]|uniref:DISARM anti-phage system protein DrmE domain-containing protein n=1 Tax=Natrialba sp. PRR66 TaxID=3098146 RepID=UPI002B1E37F5|nr:hypothetical protein [Natrialba sp. PRR66]